VEQDQVRSEVVFGGNRLLAVRDGLHVEAFRDQRGLDDSCQREVVLDDEHAASHIAATCFAAAELRGSTEGNSSVTVVPTPTSLAMRRAPPCPVRMRSTMASPRPLPFAPDFGTR